MTSPSPPSPPPPPQSLSAAIDSIHRSLSEICSSTAPADHHDSFENPRLFTGYAHRLQLFLNHLLRSFENRPASIQTALKGISSDLSQAAETVSFYRKRSKIFVLINCQSLCASLQQRTVAIGAWLALIEPALENANLPDLHKKTADLSRDMKRAQFKVTENEERVRRTLEKEGEGRKTNKAVQSAIIMDLARALGIDCRDNRVELTKQVLMLKNDLSQYSSSVSERKILMSLERSLDECSFEGDVSELQLELDREEDAQGPFSPFKNFLCPLTKEVMKEPVVLESSQVYERKAIEHWFERCIEDGRDPTCPVTGQVLKSWELKPNIGLAGAIEEWISRVVDMQVKVAVEVLSKEGDSVEVELVEKVLSSVYKISEEHPLNRYRMRNGGVVTLIVKLLKNSSKRIGTHLRGKALLALLSMTKDEESKKIMLGEGMSRLAIHSLIGSSEKERENAVKLLLEFTSDEANCIKIASEKGALVLLSSMAGNQEHPALSNLADEVLKRMESVELNIQPLAAAGRFEPLLARLCEGSDDVRIEMASLVGRMAFTNNNKEQIARRGAKKLVELLSTPEGLMPSLLALYNLSSLDDNKIILVDSAVLPALTNVLFGNQTASSESMELAASTIANIVSKPGHWELALADKKGRSMQSKSIVFKLLGLLSIGSISTQVSVLRILHGIASSPQATESVATYIKLGDGIKTIIQFLEHPEVEHRINAFGLTRLLSERFGQDFLSELQVSNKLLFLKDKLLDETSTEVERSGAACILANLPVSTDEVKALLSSDFVRWAVYAIKDQKGSNGRILRSGSSMVEGLLGLLLHFTRNLDQETLGIVREHSLMTVFQEQFFLSSSARSKQLASLGLKNLSKAQTLVASDIPEPPPPQGFCASLLFMCSRPSQPLTCPFHNVQCDENNQLCLLKTNSIKPLADLLAETDTNVQIAAIEALMTLIPHTSDNSKRAIEELEQLGVIDGVINLFTDARPGVLQERAIWMIEKVLKVDSSNHRHSLNQSLVRALVEAFKYGNANTRRHAQAALTNLKQISGVSGQSSSQNPPQR